MCSFYCSFYCNNAGFIVKMHNHAYSTVTMPILLQQYLNIIVKIHILLQQYLYNIKLSTIKVQFVDLGGYPMSYLPKNRWQMYVDFGGLLP